MKQIEWELLIIQIMFNGWKRPELFSKEFRMAYEKLKRRVLFLLLFLLRVNTKLQQLSQIRFL